MVRFGRGEVHGEAEVEGRCVCALDQGALRRLDYVQRGSGRESYSWRDVDCGTKWKALAKIDRGKV